MTLTSAGKAAIMIMLGSSCMLNVFIEFFPKGQPRTDVVVFLTKKRLTTNRGVFTGKGNPLSDL